MDPETDSYEAQDYALEDVMDDGPGAYNAEDRSNYASTEDAYSAEEYSAEAYTAETGDVTVMDTQTGDVIEMDGEVCSMDTEAVDVGCKDSPPLPDKAARDLSEDTDQLQEEEKKEDIPKKCPEKLQLNKDGTWHNKDLQEPVLEEKAPPIPIKRGNTKNRIQMFESMWMKYAWRT